EADGAAHVLRAAVAARVTGSPAILVVRRVVVVGIAGIATLGAVADALVALALVMIVAALAAAGATDDRGAGDGHISLGECVPVERAAGQSNGRPGENRPDEMRIRQRRGLRPPPGHVA